MEGERQPAPEIAPAPTSEAPVAAAIGPALGAGMGPAVNGLTTPAAVLALQRSAGNAAVTRALLARDEAKTEEKTKVTGAGDFLPSGGEPQGEGVTTVTKDPGDATQARALAPKVTMPASVKLKPGKTLGGETGQYGHIQNLSSSTRGGTYRKGGDAKGEVVSEHREGRSQRRDAASDPTDDKKIHPGATFPFYWPPVPIDDNAENVEVHTKDDTHDQPEFKMPIESEGGRLTNFHGQDNFLLAAAVKTGYGVFKFNAFTWSANWDVAVDKEMNGAGEALTKGKAKIGETPDETLKDWSLRPGSSDVWEAFATPEEAMRRTPAELLQWIGPARRHDPVSHSNIVAALTAKKPKVSATFTCTETSDLVGRDTVHIKATAGGDSYRTDTVKLKKGESQSLLFTLEELFGSIEAIGLGAEITLEVTHVDSGEEGSASFRLTGTKEVKVGSGKYTVSVTVT